MKSYKSLVKKIPTPFEVKTKQKEYLTYGALPIIDQGQALISGYTNDTSKKIKCTLPVIVFGDHTRIVKYIDFPFGAGADGIKVLQPKENICPKYLYYGTQYLVLGLEDKGYARHYQFLEKKELLVPSFPEQERIVARIEELFSELDSGIETLNKVKEQLAVYHQAVISSSYPEMTADNTRRLDEISKITGGITKGRKLSDCETIFLPYLRVANVQNGYLDLSEMKTIELKTSEKEKYLLAEGDVLYTEGGDRDKLGRGTVWNNEITDCVHQNHIFKARLDKNKALPKYVAYWSMSAFARNYFYSKGKQTVNLASINKTILSALPLPVPDIEIQKEVIENIESRISTCDSIEKCVNFTLQQAEAMRQSILKKAFEGRL